MYLQITERCNMRCNHCCFACTDKGQDMSLEVVDAVLDLFPDSHISIGGGEPTLHPYFDTILMRCLAVCESVWMATNGSDTNKTLLLAKLAKKGVLGVALSLDEWHDPIDCEVMDAFGDKYPTPSVFTLPDRTDDRREIRSVTRISKAGRAKNWGNTDECACDEPFIDPAGNVWQCGCKLEKLGNVLTDPHIDIGDYDCSRDLEKEEAA